MGHFKDINRCFRKSLVVLVTIAMLICTFMSTFAIAENNKNNSSNRLNVILVLDASGSMNNTDKSGNRYAAITQFVDLIAEKGNYVGGVVFGTEIEAEMEPRLIESYSDKEQVIDLLRSVTPDNTKDTNIGAALQRAIELLKANGDPDLSNVIVLLSDGKTDLDTEKMIEKSLEQKADALEMARENGTRIFTICLNQNGKADPEEMEQIAKATGGESQEVASSDDLKDVFLSFYNLIYGSSTLTVIDGEFPTSRTLESEFVIPGFGVEEVNIIVYGSTNSIKVYNTNNQAVNPTIKNYDTFSTVKITDIEPGVWKLVLEGEPGNSVKVNMVYNARLFVDVNIDDKEENAIEPGDDVIFKAVLGADEQIANKLEQYVGYNAVLHIYDAYGELIDSIPMSINKDHFEAKRKFDEGAYHYSVAVDCPYVSAESEIIGPVVVQTHEKVIENNPPEPTDSRIVKTVYLIPFKESILEIPMDNLAKDAEDSELHYKILSSAFTKGLDYDVQDNTIVMSHYSLKKGSFTIRATDSGGLSCDIDVLVRTVSVSLIALIALGVIGLGVVGGAVYAVSRKPIFKGTISADSINNSYGSPRTHASFKGNFKLQYFGVGMCGFDQTKSVFVAKSKSQVAFKSNKPIYTDLSIEGKKEVSLYSGDNYLYSDPERNNGIHVIVDAQLY